MFTDSFSELVLTMVLLGATVSSTELVNTMDEPFLHFEWHVKSGYQWRDWLDDRNKPATVSTKRLASPSALELAWRAARRLGRVGGPVLGEVVKGGPARSYSPMSKSTPSLFLTFAEIDHKNLSSISDFATKFGLLGVGTVFQDMAGLRRLGEHHYAWGETYLDWAREICLMREAVELTRSDRGAGEGRARMEWNDARLDPPYGDRYERCAWLLNSHLQDVKPRMLFAQDVEARLSFAPTSLLSALWLQFALSLVGDKEFRSCKFCQRLFEISTDQTGFRRHREFCSDSCKTKDYRRRKRTALKLAGGRSSLRTIAERTNTKRATVRQWLAASKKRRTHAEKGDE